MFKRSLATAAKQESPATRKRQRLDATGEPVGIQGKELLQAIEGLADSRSRAVATAFLRLPSKKLYPDYYETIKKPIALDVIRQNLLDGEYVTLDLMREDLLQMTNNAKRYNQKGSQLYADASQIARLVKQWSGDPEVYSEESEAETVTPEMNAKTVRNLLNNTIKDILQQLRVAKGRNDRDIGQDFLELPDKKLYPEYYTVTTRPLSINLLASKMRKNPYTKLTKFENDLEEMYENAFAFNEKDSEVSQDARQLKKVSDQLIAEARPMIEKQERELSQRVMTPARTQLPQAAITPSTPSTPGTITTGGFKIRLGLRQSATTPSTKVRLNLHGHNSNPRPTSSLSRVSSLHTELPSSVKLSTKFPSTRASPVPQAPSPANGVSAQFNGVNGDSPLVRNIPSPANSTPLATPALTPPATSQLSPTTVSSAPAEIYKNSGAPLITSLSLAAPQMQPPLVLHIPGSPGKPSVTYSWTIPVAAANLTISPTLCPSLQMERPYALTVTVNGRKTLSSRTSSTLPLGATTTPSIPVVKETANQIWDVKLSVGMNCIECIVEAGPTSTKTLLAPSANGAAGPRPTDAKLGSPANHSPSKQGNTTDQVTTASSNTPRSDRRAHPTQEASTGDIKSSKTILPAEQAKERFAVLIFVR